MSRRGAELTALLISPNRDLADQFTRMVAGTRAFQIVADLKSYPTLQTLDMRVRQLRPQVVLLELGSGLDTAGELIRFLTTLTPPLHVVGLHTHNDSEAILKSLRMGASEFLYAPFDVSIQEAAISRIQRLIVPEQASEQELGKIVAFASAKSGSGASTLAAQTAFSVRRASGKRVLLADFDLLNGSLAFTLRLSHEFNVVDLLQHADRMNRSLWAEVVASIDGLDVLTAPDLPYTAAVEPARLQDVLQYSRMLYDWVIVDLPSIFNRVSLLAFTESDRAFLVSTSELPSLHLTRKAVRLLQQLGFSSDRFQ
ncbi:MAG: AAA family ATPase, partial [Bryobacteraceae bacterium]